MAIMSKLSFRTRALDANKPISILLSDEIPDLNECIVASKAVPQLPSGMEKEEETEHHLQRALTALQLSLTPTDKPGPPLLIPVPKTDISITDYESTYPAGIKQPKQLIHFQELPDYDMDSDDDAWLKIQVKWHKELPPRKFESMMDRLEKCSGQSVLNLKEAKALLKESDDLVVLVYDYWLNKRLESKHSLIPSVKQDRRDATGTLDPYVAFRRRVEKMQTRKNRKNDETSFEKMLRLRRDLERVSQILELMKTRERHKKELLQLNQDIYETRHKLNDFDGTLFNEFSHSIREERNFKRYPNYASDHKKHATEMWNRNDSVGVRKRKRSEHLKIHHNRRKNFVKDVLSQSQSVCLSPSYEHTASTDEDLVSNESVSETEEEEKRLRESNFVFRRNSKCSYYAPRSFYPSNEEINSHALKHFHLVSYVPKQQSVDYVRRRVGRGGRLYLDRLSNVFDSYKHSFDSVFPSHLCNVIPTSSVNPSRSKTGSDTESGEENPALTFSTEPTCEKMFTEHRDTVKKLCLNSEFCQSVDHALLSQGLMLSAEAAQQALTMLHKRPSNNHVLLKLQNSTHPQNCFPCNTTCSQVFEPS